MPNDHSQNPAGAGVVQRAYDFLLWLFPKIERLPRSHRFTLGDRLTNLALDLQISLVNAAYSRDKASHLENASTHLNALRILLRLAKEDLGRTPHALGQQQPISKKSPSSP